MSSHDLDQRAWTSHLALHAQPQAATAVHGVAGRRQAVLVLSGTVLLVAIDVAPKVSPALCPKATIDGKLRYGHKTHQRYHRGMRPSHINTGELSGVATISDIGGDGDASWCDVALPPEFTPATLTVGDVVLGNVESSEDCRLMVGRPLPAIDVLVEGVRGKSAQGVDFGVFLSPRATGTVRQWAQGELQYLRERAGRTWSESALGLPLRRGAAGATSLFHLPVGLTSPDGSAVVGEDGFLFLVGATNDVLGQYKRSEDEVSRPTGRWADLVHERRERAAALSTNFVQMFIPEKLSVLSEISATGVTGPSPLYRSVTERLASDSYVLDAYPLLRKCHDSYLRLDTHLSAPGAKALVVELLELLMPERVGHVEAVACDSTEWARGDLVGRFGVPLFEERRLPSSPHVSILHSGVTEVEANRVRGGHVGSRFSWVNRTWPTDEHLLVFGNSFFGYAHSAIDLSWWARLFFHRVTFIWSPEVDWSLVERLRPTFVVGQTVERYMARIPAS